MIWYTVYLVAGLLLTTLFLIDVRSMRKHAAECDRHREAKSFLDKLDESPPLLGLVSCFMILLWPVVVFMFLMSLFDDDDDDDNEDDNDPQTRVPVQYR